MCLTHCLLKERHNNDNSEGNNDLFLEIILELILFNY